MLMGSQGTQGTATEQVSLVKENARELCQVLKSLQFREHGIFHFSKNGMRVIVEDNAYQQAVAYFEQTVFKNFELSTDITFRAPLIDIAEVLGMMEGDGYSVKIRYTGYGSPLNVSLVAAEEEYRVEARIHTLEAEQMNDFADLFNSHEIQLMAIMKPEVLKEVIRSTDESAHSLTIKAKSYAGEEGKQSVKIAFISASEVGKTTTTVRSTSTHVEKMEIEREISFVYHYRLIKRFLSALGISRTVAIRIDSQGTMCTQFLLEREKDEQVFIEFYCVPSNEDED